MLPAKIAKIAEEARISRLLFGDKAEEKRADDDDGENDDDDDDKPRKAAPVVRKAAWRDDDDDAAEEEDEEGEAKKRRSKFEAVVGRAEWASLDRPIEEDPDDDLLRTVGHVEKATRERKARLELKRVRALNAEAKHGESLVNVVRFHPTSAVALYGGKAGVLTLVAVDGRQNEKLHSVAFEKRPVLCARFTPDGREALVGSHRADMYVYDLVRAEARRVPLPQPCTKTDAFELSPCGKYAAVVGRDGDVRVLCARSLELVAALKRESRVAGHAAFAPEGGLLAHGADGSVVAWDLRATSRGVAHRFADEGCARGACVAVSPCGGLLAAGSAHGVVNLYDYKAAMASAEPKPRRTLTNLRAGVTQVEFGARSELLAFHSRHAANAVRLARAPDFRVCAEFPPYPADFGHVSQVHFSPNGGYFAFGTNKRTAHLYRVKNYKNY